MDCDQVERMQQTITDHKGETDKAAPVEGKKDGVWGVLQSRRVE
jgi:hypothetical protein